MILSNLKHADANDGRITDIHGVANDDDDCSEEKGPITRKLKADIRRDPIQLEDQHDHPSFWYLHWEKMQLVESENV